ncbi:MAG: hypothetical protein JWN32_1130 [Solirubrobacterales bacterium]|jgi:hypothetical protein|nr:hypothetical protein [Solirubrobacterales bacterium]
MYPVTLQVDPQLEGRNRLTTFFRGLMAIPVMIVAFLFAIGVEIAVFIAWFALVFTGRYPQGLYDFVAKGVRMFGRVNAYYYLLTDEYPPFNGDPDAAYPVRVDVAPAQGSYDRIKVFFRGLLLIPVWIVAYLYAIGLGVVTMIAWFAILFTGKYPAGMFDFARNASAYMLRANAYMFLVTDQFPPVSEEPQVAPVAPVI